VILIHARSRVIQIAATHYPLVRTKSTASATVRFRFGVPQGLARWRLPIGTLTRTPTIDERRSSIHHTRKVNLGSDYVQYESQQNHYDHWIKNYSPPSPVLNLLEVPTARRYRDHNQPQYEIDHHDRSDLPQRRNRCRSITTRSRGP